MFVVSLCDFVGIILFLHMDIIEMLSWNASGFKGTMEMHMERKCVIKIA